MTAQPLSAAEAAIVERFEVGEPAPESWRGDDGLREVVAEGLLAEYRAIWGQRRGWNLTGRYADAVLALPEVTALRAKAAAADRVRECIDGMDPIEVALGGLMYVHSEIRRALDDPC